MVHLVFLNGSTSLDCMGLTQLLGLIPCCWTLRYFGFGFFFFPPTYFEIILDSQEVAEIVQTVSVCPVSRFLSSGYISRDNSGMSQSGDGRRREPCPVLRHLVARGFV